VSLRFALIVFGLLLFILIIIVGITVFFFIVVNLGLPEHMWASAFDRSAYSAG
jgi:uncharacterized protein (UPF0333 family)